MQHSGTQGVRMPAQAGRFYDADADALRQAITVFLDPAEPATGPAPLALVAPHAGYVYSGTVAGAAYRQIVGRAIDRVMILGPCHYEDVEGAALTSAAAWRTPLGQIQVDTAAIEALAAEPDFAVRDSAHQPEHAIEVQLPFLQMSLGSNVSILPILIGKPPAGGLESIGQALVKVTEKWDREALTWLIVASSDTYHGYDGDSCRQNDEALGALFEKFDVQALQAAFVGRQIMACGWAPIVLALMVAGRRGACTARVLRRTDSRQVTGETSGYVVGYIAGRVG